MPKGFLCFTGTEEAPGTSAFNVQLMHTGVRRQVSYYGSIS